MVNSGSILKTPFLDADSQQSSKSKVFKVGIAILGGSCLVLLGIMVVSAYNPTLLHNSAAESTNLFGMPTSLRLAAKPSPVLPMTLRNLPGPSPWKELALAGIEASNRCDRDFSANANRFQAMVDSLSSKDKAMVSKAASAVTVRAQEMLKPGQVAPLGFWDPMGLSSTLDEGKLLFYREAEIKHGRVCMLATLGIAVGEQFHPLFGGNIDVAAVKVFTQVPLDELWPIAFLQFFVAAGFEEWRTSGPLLQGRAFGGLNPGNTNMEGFAFPSGRLPGDIGFDPLGLKPKNDKDLLAMQNKEILNGRLAMIAYAGIISQEMVTGEKIFR